MSNSKEKEIQQEIDKISADIKSIMKKVEALYPKERAEGTENSPEQEDSSKTDDESEK